MTLPLTPIRTAGEVAMQWLANMLRVSDKYLFNRPADRPVIDYIRKEIRGCRNGRELRNIQGLIQQHCKGRVKEDLMLLVDWKKAIMN